MDIVQVSEHLSLLPSLNRKQVVDLLFNLGHIHKEFKQLLSLTHNPQTQKKLMDVKQNVRLKEGHGSLLRRLHGLLNGNTTNLSTYEYHTVYTLADSPYITKATRESLRTTLEYLPYSGVVASVKIVTPCAICGYQSSGDICLSCKRNTAEYTKYRRDTFSIEVNYLNFNIRQYINTTGTFQWHYYDWLIEKSGLVVKCKLIQELAEPLTMVQYELPFIDYQKKLSNS